MPINFSTKKVFIRKIIIKENQSHFFFIGTYNIKNTISYLQIKKLNFNKYNYKEYYSYKLKDIIDEKDISEEQNNNSITQYFEQKLDAKDYPLKNVKEINSIFGFIKFNMGYYAIFSCDSEIVGKIGRNIIYRVDRLFYFPLFDAEDDFKQGIEYVTEGKYISLVKSFGYDKQLYFSYSYDLTKTLQRNFVENFKNEMIPNFKKKAYTKNTDFELFSKKAYNYKNDSLSKFTLEDIPENTKKDEKFKLYMKTYTNHHFCWNYFHMKEFFNSIKNKAWVNFFMYGYFHQVVCNIKGFSIIISIAARRNRNFAGMRYLKRGISDDGNVANDVETEQIMEEVSTTWTDRPKISSYIQIRGSIPIFWYQNQSSFFTKPPIHINLSDIKFDATKRHFAILVERYGHPCIVCNLTKKNEEKGKEQETILNEWYYNGINYINKNIDNKFEKILYYHFDLKNERGQKNFYKQFYDISGPFIAKTNLFCFIPNMKNKYNVFLQNGVVRTNCIDCLDRTNVFQQILGIAVLVIQLRYIGINENFPENENESIFGVLTELYIKMGHELASQYTGSLAIKQAITDHRNLMDKVIDSFNEILIAIKRSWINYFIDQYKQNAMNLFLGKYPINKGLPLIWDLPSDEILHKKKGLKELEKNWYEEKYKKYIIFNLFSDFEHIKKLQNKGKLIIIEKSGEIYTDKKSSLGLDNNRKDYYKLSTTSLLIFNDLMSKNNTNNIIHRDSNSKIKKVKTNKILPYYNSSLDELSANINQYILDYSSYIEYKSKSNNIEDEEEKAFNDDSIMYFLSEVIKRDIRDFNHFEYYNINYIKKNVMNNNNVYNNATEKQIHYDNNNINRNNNFKNKSYFEDFYTKPNFTSRKSVANLKFSTPIKNKMVKSRYINILNDPFRNKSIKDTYIQNFVPYTPFIPQFTSNFNSISPNFKNKYCTNPRNVAELKREMIKLDITTFQYNNDDFTKINEFSQAVDKQLKKNDIYELDPFNTCDLQTSEGIFETQKITEVIQEFDPFKSMFNEEKNKEEIENEVDDYIIFDVKKNMLYKKCPETINKKTNLMPTKDFFSNTNDLEKKEENKNYKNNGEDKSTNEKEQINKDDKKNVKSSEEETTGKEENPVKSPKIKIRRIKRLPLKIEEDYFMIKQPNSIEKFFMMNEKEK